MKTKVLQRFFGISLAYFLSLITGILPADTFAASNNQSLTIQNVTLRPGDVINLRGGFATYVNAGDTGGHAAMYLGIIDGKQKVFDFTVTKKVQGEDGRFRGRILDVDEFLKVSSKAHNDFSVYRLRGSKVNQGNLAAAAKRIAEKQSWVIPNLHSFSTTCAGAVAQALDAAVTGKRIGFTYRPDKLTDENDLFQRISPVVVNIRAAINERLGVQISGDWYGIYHYDDSKRVGVEGKFTMTVNQSGSAISGRIKDDEIGYSSFSGTIKTSSTGRLEIHFIKTYDNSDYDQVEYIGVVTSSGNIVDGTWHIGNYRGNWMMHRKH